MSHWRAALHLLVVLLIALLSSALAQERPEAADLEAAFSQRVPPGWQLAEFIVEAQENYGTEVEPDVRTRFRAIVASREDTFEPAGELEGASLLRPLMKAGEQRTFFGIAISQRQLGNWETRFSLENDPTIDAGFVIDYFPGRRLILGTENEAEFRRQLEAEAQAATEATLARRKREEQLREQERAEELSAVAHEVTLQEKQLAASQEAELAGAKREAALAAALREQEAAERTARQAELAELLQELPAHLAAELRLQLGSYWSIGEVELIEPVLKNSFAEPTFEAAFNVPLTLREAVYTPRRVEDDVLLLDPDLPAGRQHDLRGIITAQWSGGIWSVSFRFENLQGIGDGAPRGQFPPQALIAGSAEEAAFHEALELRLAEMQQRELAEIQRKQAVQTAEHEAQRSAAAEEAQLEAMKLAARAAEYRALEASILDGADPAARIAALEFALNSADDLIVRAAIPVALVSGNSHLVSLALKRTLLDGGGVQLSRKDPSGAIWLTGFAVDGVAGITAELQGSGHTSYPSDFKCGSLTGRIENGELSLANDRCKVQLYPLGANQLEARVLSTRTHWWTFQSPYPGSRTGE